jgi:hypothetical protein
MKNTSYILLWFDGLTDTDFEGYDTLENARIVALEYAQFEGQTVAIWSEESSSVVEIVTAPVQLAN